MLTNEIEEQIQKMTLPELTRLIRVITEQIELCAMQMTEDRTNEK